jgi:hypothetical protein
MAVAFFRRAPRACGGPSIPAKICRGVFFVPPAPQKTLRARIAAIDYFFCGL